MSEEKPFWDHLEDLRRVLLRIVAVVVAAGIAAFCFKEKLFEVLLAPRFEWFPTYRLLENVAALLGDASASAPFSMQLINTSLAGQFSLHLQMAAYAGLLLASPYIIKEVFGFISPGLYDGERRTATRLTVWAYVMFLIGCAVAYFIIFPMTFRFLGTYQVDPSVPNMITLGSYLDTLMMLCLVMGLMFEMPVVCLLLGKAGLLSRSLMRRYRKHAIVGILLAAAIITPSGDIMSMLLMSLPIWVLYEVSVMLLPQEKKEEAINGLSVNF